MNSAHMVDMKVSACRTISCASLSSTEPPSYSATQRNVCACFKSFPNVFGIRPLLTRCSLNAFIKTHRGLMNAFSEHLVKSGRIPKTLGKLLKQAQTFRCVADYEGGSVELSDAQEMVRQA